jgi:hypothetical protein
MHIFQYSDQILLQIIFKTHSRFLSNGFLLLDHDIHYLGEVFKYDFVSSCHFACFRFHSTQIVFLILFLTSSHTFCMRMRIDEYDAYLVNRKIEKKSVYA